MSVIIYTSGGCDHGHGDTNVKTGSLNIDGRGIRGSKSESYAPSKKCNPSSGDSDAENIARKNPVRRCI